ncbi:PREDICTED: proline-rich receptor-like protein kinase PERK2 [Papilio xuthus]|uniref:Proline-rich receptor-like protein kinase PERK2 n=1 Tax=Papilio xuthus TaxID=66420 RepID=A0AAJ6ZAX0_PAPXU|nr:PREDICTED: proline-rich receptor-like protein kinase PERK2 [Papilio xuthus]
MGVPGSYGAGATKIPSHVAYYVAMAGILLLLICVCCYFIFFCLRRIKELSHHEFQEVRSVRPPPPPQLDPPPLSPTAYPVQPGVRESATAMARLCRALPQDTVFPASPGTPARGHSAFSPTSPVPLLASPPRLPVSPTSPNRRVFAYYTSPRRSISPTSPNRRSDGYYISRRGPLSPTSPRRGPLSPTSPSRRHPLSPTSPRGRGQHRAATVPARRVRSPHKPPAIVLSPATDTCNTLPALTVIPLR